MYVKGKDIPAGYRAMRQEDVRNNWDACTIVMGPMNNYALLDGSVDGWANGNSIHDSGAV